MKTQTMLEERARRFEELAETLGAEGKHLLAREARLEAVAARAEAAQIPEKIAALVRQAAEAALRAEALKAERKFLEANEASAELAILNHRIRALEH